MHLEPAETDLNVPIPGRISQPPATEEERPQPAREGLPAAFRMRRDRHYVEQLMGDAPLRTVREIPMAEIEPPREDEADLAPLRESVREMGILQPLLVFEGSAGAGQDGAPAASGKRFTIIAGANRYRVALELGLRTVPCIVVETGAHSVDALREAVACRAATPTDPEPPMATAIPDRVHPSAPAAGLRDVTARLAFVSAVMPALDVAGYDPLRWNILTDLMRVEMERARSTAAAVEWLSSPDAPPTREPIDAAGILDAVLEAIGPEARLQGVTLDVSSSLSGYAIPVDRAMIVRALTGMAQAMLALSPSGSTLRLECNGTTVRPAMIVGITQEACAVTPEAADRFFDAGSLEHPAGPTNALVLAGAAHAARAHGGRVHARAHERRGCTVTFVVPRPLSD